MSFKDVINHHVKSVGNISQPVRHPIEKGAGRDLPSFQSSTDMTSVQQGNPRLAWFLAAFRRLRRLRPLSLRPRQTLPSHLMPQLIVELSSARFQIFQAHLRGKTFAWSGSWVHLVSSWYPQQYQHSVLSFANQIRTKVGLVWRWFRCPSCNNHIRKQLGKQNKAWNYINHYSRRSVNVQM